MSRKDFKLIAEVLANSGVDDSWEDLVADFIVALGRTNSAFSAEKFWEACHDQT